MATKLKSYELREHGSEDLGHKLAEAKEEYFNLRFQNATGQLENYGQLHQVKRRIARIETIVRERALGIDVAGERAPESTGPSTVKTEKKTRRWMARKGQAAPEAATGPDESDDQTPGDGLEGDETE